MSFFDPRETAATDAAARAIFPELATDAQLHAQSMSAMVDDAASLTAPPQNHSTHLVGSGGLGSVPPMTPEQYAAFLAHHARPASPAVADYVPSELRPGTFVEGTDRGMAPISPQEAQQADHLSAGLFPNFGERDYANPVVTGPPRAGGPGMGD